MTTVPPSSAPRPPDPWQELRDRYDVLLVRQVISDTVLMTTIGTVLRRLPEALRREVLAELRSRIGFSPEMFSNPADGHAMALVAEEAAANLLDKIDRFTGPDA